MRWIGYAIFVAMLCGMTQSHNGQTARELSDEAHKFYVRAVSDKAAAKLALELYDEAIRTDSTYYKAYWNKAMLLCVLGRRREALRTFHKLSLIRPDMIGILSNEGFILERLGESNRAHSKYTQEIAKCDSVINTLTDSMSISLRITRASLMMYTEGKDAGVKEFNRLVAKYPNNALISGQRDYFYGFDRKKAIRDFCN